MILPGCWQAFPPPIVVVAKSAWLHFRLAAKIAPTPLLLLSPQEPLRWVPAGAPFNASKRERAVEPSKRKSAGAELAQLRKFA